ncbi:RGS7 [Acrasis kona]|uniref:RGS7 n=1 Tax=Acrasis kona TaxID=1008807 RepID=A0AAW2Z3F7_9EUKA
MSLFESGPPSPTELNTTPTAPDEQSFMTHTLMTWRERDKIGIFKAGSVIKRTTREKLFSLRCKTLVVLSMFFLMAIVAFSAVLFGLFPYKFIEVEDNRVYNGYDRVTNYLSNHYVNLWTIARDTGYRSGNATDFEIENMIPIYNASLENAVYYSPLDFSLQGINFISFHRSDGSIFYQIGFRSAEVTSAFRIIQTGLNSFGQLTVGVNPLVANNNTDFVGTAIYDLSGQPLMLTSAVVRNDVKTVGWITVGLIQNEDFIQDMAENVQMCVTALSVSDLETRREFIDVLKLNPAIPSIKTNWNVDRSNKPSTFDEKLLNGRACPMRSSGKPYTNRRTGAFAVTSVFGAPAFIYRLDIETYNLYIGLVGVFICFAILLVGIILITIVILSFVDRGILYRVKFITKQLEKITEDRNVKARLDNLSKRGDEVNVLGVCVNKMLQSLENDSQKIFTVLNQTLSYEERSRNILKSINDYVICILVKDGTIHEANPSFQEKFRFDPNHNRGTVSITKFLSTLTLNDLTNLSGSAKRIESELVTGFNMKIPVTITASPCRIIVDEESRDALVVVAQNKTEQKDMAKMLRGVLDDLNFAKVWDDPVSRRDFWQYCAKERSTENVNFLQEIEVYRSTKAVDERVKLQNQILQKFLLPTSEQLLNLSAKILDKQLPLVKEGYAQRDLFDALGGFVRSMVVSDTFTRYMDQKKEQEQTEM